LAEFDLIACALCGRNLRVLPSAPGEASWTDGSVIFIDTAASERAQLEALSVQASLLAANSLRPQIARRLIQRSIFPARYLAVEGHRALAALEHLLPPSLRSLIDFAVAARSLSAEDSLALAVSQAPIADPPIAFGIIRARALLAPRRAEASPETGIVHSPHDQRPQTLAEFAEEEAQTGLVPDIFSSPGYGGALGRLLQRMLRAVRKVSGGGSPGAHTPTHRTQLGATRGARTVHSTVAASGIEGGPARWQVGLKYPEWDVHKRSYRPHWCTVQELEPRLKDDAPMGVSDTFGLRRPLARLGMGLDRVHRQRQGDEIDLDAAIEARILSSAGVTPDEAVYVNTLRQRRDLAVLLLLDVSGSVAEPAAAGGRTVHEQQRTAAAALAKALEDIGDRIALYAFHSQGRSAVHLVPVKRFHEGFDAHAVRRLYSLTPCAYSRLGAAIRHGTAVLEEQGGTSRRLLVVLSDGLAYDDGYEPAYGAADVKRALAESRLKGIGCLCLSIGAQTDNEVLRRVFGSAAHATIPEPQQLRQVLAPLFRSALRSAEVKRQLIVKNGRFQDGTAREAVREKDLS
jgi:hypothetical protein